MIYSPAFNGGFALGAYWAGMRFDKHYFSEVEPYAVELYRKRFPDAIPLGDITKVDWGTLMDDTEGQRRQNGATSNEGQAAGNVNSFSNAVKIRQEYIITGGFPCQDISVAGKGAGIEGSRSGLWSEMFRAIRILRPRFTIIENVGAITFRGLDRVLSDLAEIGYNAEWQDIRASDMGAPHKRERIWIIAYPNTCSNGCYDEREKQKKINGKVTNQGGKFTSLYSTRNESEKRQDVAYSKSISCNSENQSKSKSQKIQTKRSIRDTRSRPGEWLPEPCMGMLVDGLPSGLDRFEGRLSNKSYKAASQIKGIGNAILPQIAELFFKWVKELL